MEHDHHCKPHRSAAPSATPFLSASTSTSTSTSTPILVSTTPTNQHPAQQTILKSLIEKTTKKGEGEGETAQQPPFKFIANSTIIQHLGSPKEPEKHGRRGMHSAVGAYWNNEKDGTFTHKWEAADSKGMDIVITITWVAL
jgi:hypothetical protein